MSDVYNGANEARIALQRAVKRGDLIRQPCFTCGETEVEGHHVAYDLPLDVVWLCHRHHVIVHLETKRLKLDAMMNDPANRPQGGPKTHPNRSTWQSTLEEPTPYELRQLRGDRTLAEMNALAGVRHPRWAEYESGARRPHWAAYELLLLKLGQHPTGKLTLKMR